MRHHRMFDYPMTARKNPGDFFSPFSDYMTDPERSARDLSVGHYTMTAWSPAGVKMAARILVNTFRIPLALHQQLTQGVGPMLKRGSDSYDHLVVESQGHLRTPSILFRVFIEKPSAQKERELLQLGFVRAEDGPKTVEFERVVPL